jgi:hypothetical protein
VVVVRSKIGTFIGNITFSRPSQYLNKVSLTHSPDVSGRVQRLTFQHSLNVNHKEKYVSLREELLYEKA